MPTDARARRRSNIVVFSLLGVGVLVVIAIVAAGAAFRHHDRTHVISVTCTVRSAEAGLGGSSSSRGSGALFDQVEIRTADCGTLTLRNGVDDDEAAIVRALDRGGRFTFRVGAASFRWRAVLTRFRTPVVVTSFRPAD